MNANPKHVIFLMSAITAASPDTQKQSAFTAEIDRLFEDISEERRRDMVVRTLSARPRILGGLDLLRFVERSCEKISQKVEPREAYTILRSLLAIARANGIVSDLEQMILRAAHARLNLTAHVSLEDTDNGLKLKRIRAAA